MSTKDELLTLLEKERLAGRSLSGEDAAARLGVSRVAVWKAVESLRREGYEIAAAKGAGYSLAGGSGLSAPRIRAHLPPHLSALKIFTYDLTDSTNNRAKVLAGEGFSGMAVFAANAQSAGRGRLGRSFYSPADTGVYFSFLFSSRAPLETLNAVTPCAAVAAAKALERATGEKIGIKWVNDLCYRGKKICGILTEAVTALDEGSENRIIVGIGINLNTTSFPEELREKAGSLCKTPDRAALIADTVAALASFAENPADRSFMDDYRARSVVTGKRVTLSKWSETIEGTVLGFDDNGGLILDVNGEKKVFTGGEISLRLSESFD